MEKCKTLGEEAFFEFTCIGGQLTIRYGANGIEQQAPAELVATVIQRVSYLQLNDAEHSRMTGYYSIPHWAECPDMILCPYIAKLVLDVFPDVVIEELGILIRN
jgi:hypothetical protein